MYPEFADVPRVCRELSQTDALTQSVTNFFNGQRRWLVMYAERQSKRPMEQTPHILVVDDHRDIRELVAKYLRKHGLRATTAASSNEARGLMTAHAFDLAVLDIMMPGEDGLSLCREMLATQSLPIIFLTAMAEETDRIVGLELGADDYLTKPFNPRELLARIKAVLRRAQSLPASREATLGTRLRFGRWTYHTDRRELTDDDAVVTPLSTGEHDLLMAFAQHPGMVLSRDQLLDLAKGRSAKVFDRSIDNQVSRLRKKVEEDPKDPKLIQTVWGGGYRFAAKIEPQ